MAKQDRRHDRKREGEKREAPVGPHREPAHPEAVEKGRKIRQDVDKLLNEIDEVLEENAEEFVKNYVQKGGE